jgi:hypothetical protein
VPEICAFLTDCSGLHRHISVRLADLGDLVVAAERAFPA